MVKSVGPTAQPLCSSGGQGGAQALQYTQADWHGRGTHHFLGVPAALPENSTLWNSKKGHQPQWVQFSPIVAAQSAGENQGAHP